MGFEALAIAADPAEPETTGGGGSFASSGLDWLHPARSATMTAIDFIFMSFVGV
jgi:hypothetical protein